MQSLIRVSFTKRSNFLLAFRRRANAVLHMNALRTLLAAHQTKIGFFVAAVVLLRCIWIWQPERQVRLHQRHLLDAAQDRNWKKLSAFLDDGFRSSGGHDKTRALQDANEVLRPFFTLQILDSEKDVSMEPGTGRVCTVLRMEGKGMELGELIRSAVNASHEPFVFTWKRASWKPWDWRLVRAEHPLIGLAGGQLPAL